MVPKKRNFVKYKRIIVFDNPNKDGPLTATIAPRHFHDILRHLLEMNLSISFSILVILLANFEDFCMFQVYN